MMFNVPVVGGSTGHAVGATLIAILLGPWAAVIAISIALVVQAGLFGDGGITALAANCFTMAVVMPFTGYYVYRLLAGDRPSPRRRLAAGGAGGYVGIVAGAVVAGVLFGIQPYLAHTADRPGALRAVPPGHRRAGHGARASGVLRPDRGAGHGGRPRGAGAHAAGTAGATRPRRGRCAGSGRASPRCCSSPRWARWPRARPGVSGAASSSRPRWATCRATSSA